MKKILVVLLILSVAWGVFAQDGSWRLSGDVEVGTRLDFDPTPWTGDGVDDNKATAGGVAYNTWDNPRGKFNLIYGTFINDGSLSVGLQFNTRADGAENEPFFSYNGEGFNFKTALYGNSLLVGGAGQDTGSAVGNSIKRLYGNFAFVNGIVFVEAAFRGEQQEFWISDTTAGSGRLGTHWHNGMSPAGSSQGTDKVNHAGFFGKPATFTYTDSGGANYLLTDIRLDAISFGLVIPNLLGGRYNYYAGYGAMSQDATTGVISGSPRENPYKNTLGGELVDDILKQTIFGVKFAMAPIEFAAQFKVQDAGAYIGAKFSAGPATIGASFSGILSPEDIDGDGMKDNAKFFKVGGDLDFNGGVFAAGVMGSMERTSDANDSGYYIQLIRVQPRFSYSVIPSHLGFTLDAGFYFFNATSPDETRKDMTWAVQPQLFWSFLGTGARRSYPWGGTGVIARYRIVSAGADWRSVAGLGAFGGPATSTFATSVEDGGWMSVNALDIVFQFSF